VVRLQLGEQVAEDLVDLVDDLDRLISVFASCIPSLTRLLA